ncbi:digalactosyldiacylglycerol synthase 1, chloroplastic [Amborella trichopoda]|uniref:Digalactosyldiacylglycerol synthase 1, chloroplastic n=1 Tax=Amborella trichopoda TaxID=13333 RepID=U5D3W3_AMBTC|nr:digalactosyldiacylglycerol synthase 1, chloroplastic [Amborella trichopoda]ERN16097.1 hypothetical protein AMTR_s00030p00179690 [Amborella trichopoda]|eukprot:XP_006854630.1 digalactosyldiacylglycerol synthase 1, chloroplastic [Amborella trichopoda]
MINLRPEPRTSSSATAEKALSFISKGWREVRENADADLQLMRARANSFKDLATSFDRELENLLSFKGGFETNSLHELGFVKKLQPKLSEFRRAYSTPNFGRAVLGNWSPSSKLDLLNLVSEQERKIVRRRVRTKKPNFQWKEEGDGQKEWEPFKVLRTGLKELERRASSGVPPPDIFTNFKNSEFVEKLKNSLKSVDKDSDEWKDVAPLDVPELLAYLVKQSGPLLDQLGVRRDMCDKIVDALCSNKRKDHLELSSVANGEDNVNTNDELDLRIASVLKSTGYKYQGGLWTDSTNKDFEGQNRNVAIITTASLPWMTGTAINPLFRAAYLSKSAKQNVTLLVPWLCKSDQELVYPNNLTFDSPEEQEAYIRNWLEARVGFKTDFKIAFYPGKFQKERRSIIAAGDTTQFIPSKEADIAILEEPEHLNWYHHGKRWTDKFNHVVGVVHTNYLEYIKRERNGALQAFFVKHINNWVIRAYCHKVLRLSSATQDLPKSVVCNVHGVNPKFLKVGEKVAAEREQGQQAFSKGAYFLGKMVWAKGYRELIDLLSKHKHDLGGFKLDVYGNGEDSLEVQSTAQKLDLNLNFLKGRDHADDSLHGYKVFINPSASDVLCTATAEALAMGKFVICADHPSNEFFRSFPNCLTYKTSEDFVSRVREAMESEPQPLTPEQRYNLSWEAATQRFIEYAELDKVLNNSEEAQPSGKGFVKMKKSVSLPGLNEIVDGGLAFGHYCLTGTEILRLSTGAIPGTKDYDFQHCQDLHLFPPQVENPVYGW